jgi:hypothetical protein
MPPSGNVTCLASIDEQNVLALLQENREDGQLLHPWLLKSDADVVTRRVSTMAKAKPNFRDKMGDCCQHQEQDDVAKKGRRQRRQSRDLCTISMRLVNVIIWAILLLVFYQTRPFGDTGNPVEEDSQMIITPVEDGPLLNQEDSRVRQSVEETALQPGIVHVIHTRYVLLATASRPCVFAYFCLIFYVMYGYEKNQIHAGSASSSRSRPSSIRIV